MTLDDASSLALSAAEAGDLDALASAMELRAEAIAAGGIPTPEIIADGQRTIELLQALIRAGVLDSARLGQVLAGFTGSLNVSPNIDYRA